MSILMKTTRLKIKISDLLQRSPGSFTIPSFSNPFPKSKYQETKINRVSSNRRVIFCGILTELSPYICISKKLVVSVLHPGNARPVLCRGIFLNPPRCTSTIVYIFPEQRFQFFYHFRILIIYIIFLPYIIFQII